MRDRAPIADTVTRGLPRVLLGGLAVALVAAAFAGLAPSSTVRASADPCGPRGATVHVGGSPDACTHIDAAPAGVDVHDFVSTNTLSARPGGGPAAVDAASDLGVPTATPAADTSPDVPCDGNGIAGYRVQPMYVVEAGRTNRYADLLSSFQQWAAGTDDVFNRSAALTGGVRHLRYVTTTDGTTCVASVLNVTVPAGATANFNATIGAVQALGYTDPTRKYLMWTDANVLCGIATLYNSDAADQSNINNGTYPQYARVDTGCWGLGSGAGQHSVEAHELSHTLGGVQNTAPHSTHAGHCWDESDLMCYSDGGTHAMQQICPFEDEALLDCNSDDYYSTYPDPGGYLATHWDETNSRFLIGGGDGTGGGAAGSPTVLGAIIAVNNPAVPGLPTQVSVAPSLPDGRALVSVHWTSPRADCAFGTPTDVQSDVTCSATATGSTTVTATLQDSTGATKTITSPLTFATGTSRPVTVGLGVDGQAADAFATAQLCTGASVPATATVRDAATGKPIKGLTATFTRRPAGATVASSAGTATSSATGTATVQLASTTAATIGVGTPKTAVYAAATPSTLPVTVSACTVALTAAADQLGLYYGDPLVVAGTATRSANGLTLPVGSTDVPVTLTTRSTSTTGATITRTTTLGTARTAADGGFRLAVPATASGTVAATVPASAAFAATSAPVGDLAVALPQPSLTAGASTHAVYYGDPVTVTGSLTQTAGSSTTNVAGQTVSVKVTPPGKPAVTVGTARTGTDGTYRVAFNAAAAGALSASTSATAGLPAASASAGDLSVAVPQTTLSASVDRTTAYYGDTVTVSGAMNRVAGSATTPAAAQTVTVKVTAPGKSPVTVGTTRTDTTGAYRATFAATVPGTVTVTFVGTAALPAATAGVGDLTVLIPATALTAAADKLVVGYRAPVTLAGLLTRIAGPSTTALAARTVTFAVTPAGKAPVTLGTARTDTTGKYTAPVPATASGELTATFAAAPGLPAATADVGALTVGTWTPALTAAVTPTSTTAGAAVTLSGTVTRTYNGSTEPARALVLHVYAQAAGTLLTSVSSTTTTSTGTYTLRVYPRTSTTYTVKVEGVTGYATAVSPSRSVTVN